jgi:hypothetical protein
MSSSSPGLKSADLGYDILYRVTLRIVPGSTRILSN